MPTTGVIKLANGEVILTRRTFDAEQKPDPVFFDLKRKMSAPVVGHLMTLLDLQHGREIRPTFQAMCAFLYNMRVSESLSGDDGPCPIVTSRRPAAYTGTGLGYKTVRRVLDAALAADPPLITQTLGEWGENRSEIRPTEALIELLRAEADWEFVFDLGANAAVVVLRNEAGRSVAVPSTPHTSDIRQDLARINANSTSRAWSYTDAAGVEKRLHPQNLLLHRVFNNRSLERGGRFYCTAQSLRKSERATLKVDGRATVELDFRELHPTMLYHERRLDAPAECYGFPIPRLPTTGVGRTIRKLAMLIVINSSRKHNQQRALKRGLERRELALPRRVSCKSVLDAVKAAHRPIADAFCTGAGLRLQGIDASIAEEVLLSFAREHKPCLCVHDSFVVAAEDAEFLRICMDVAYFIRLHRHAEIASAT